jgi:hypothetical protein
MEHQHDTRVNLTYGGAMGDDLPTDEEPDRFPYLGGPNAAKALMEDR